jgi:3-deoxy-D-manno-octulosonic-acid transferase
MKKRTNTGLEDKKRYKERFAISNAKRPKGKLIWIHASSVGELSIAIPLIKRYKKKFPDEFFLVTTNTKSSAVLFEKAALTNSIHQYLPVDVPFITKKFCQHWRPNLSIFIESEFWPNLLIETKKYCKILMINTHISSKSFATWSKFKPAMSYLNSLCSGIFPKSIADLERISYFGNNEIISYMGNLKNYLPSITYSSNTLSVLRQKIANRTLLLATSTHRGEEEIIVGVHKRLKSHYNNLLTIIIPRHIDRTAEILRITSRHMLKTAIYTVVGSNIGSEDEIYLINTVGELGVFYKLAGFAFVGGSLVKKGGHNILEAANLRAAVISGPYNDNFKEAVDLMLKENAISIVNNEEELYKEIKRLFDNPGELELMRENTIKASSTSKKLIDFYIKTLNESLN